jgi:hypothetical protein
VIIPPNDIIRPYTMSLVINSNEHVENERNKKLLAMAIELLKLTKPHDIWTIPCNCAGLGPDECCEWHKKMNEFEKLGNINLGRLGT